MNPTTRKYPRTLAEAFGPYEGLSANPIAELSPTRDRYFWPDRALVAVGIAAILAIIYWS